MPHRLACGAVVSICRREQQSFSIMSVGTWQLHRAVATLQRGGLIAYPTEAVWGLGCDPFNADAVQRLLDLKRRPMHKGLILVAADLSQLEPLLTGFSPAQREQLCQPGPRPTTWLLPHHNAVPGWITGEHESVAVRLTRHPLVAALCRQYGGMVVSTSANPSDMPPARDELAARRYFRSAVDCYLSGPTQGLAQASQIINFLTGERLR